MIQAKPKVTARYTRRNFGLQKQCLALGSSYAAFMLTLERLVSSSTRGIQKKVGLSPHLCCAYGRGFIREVFPCNEREPANVMSRNDNLELFIPKVGGTHQGLLALKEKTHTTE